MRVSISFLRGLAAESNFDQKQIGKQVQMKTFEARSKVHKIRDKNTNVCDQNILVSRFVAIGKCNRRTLIAPAIIDLLMGLFRGAVFHHDGGARKQPMKQPTEMPTSTMALVGRFPSLMGRFPTLIGRFPDFVLRGRFAS